MLARAENRRSVGAYTAILLIPVLWALVASNGATASTGTDRLYWAEYNHLSSVGFTVLDESGAGGVLTAPGATMVNAAGLALDLQQNRGYFGAYKGVSFVDLEGGPGGDLPLGVATPGNISSVAIDPVAGVLYWTDSIQNKIGFSRVDGSGGGYLQTGSATVADPIGIAVDPALGRVYWMNDQGEAGTISYARTDGGGGGDIFSGAKPIFYNPQGIAIDPVGERIYWTNVYGQTIYSVALDGNGGATELDTTGATKSNPAGLAVDSERGRLYWGSVTGGKISYANLDGTGGADLKLPVSDPGGPSFPNLLKPPTATATPLVTRDGDLLNCSSGIWRPDTVAAFVFRTPSRYEYQWTRDGSPIAGATGSTYGPASPGQYLCTVTGVNPSGSDSATSQPVAVLPAAPTPTSTPTLPLPLPQSRPVLTGLRLSPSRFAVAGVRKGTKIGTTIYFELDRAAAVRFVVQTQVPGRRTGSGACAKPTRTNRKAGPCHRLVGRGSFDDAGTTGANSLRFGGRVSGKNLAPGAYVLIATPSASGLGGTPVSATFKVKSPPRRP